MDLFECAICFNSYDTQKYKPILPTCGHTLCHDCLSQIMKKFRDQQLCPWCKVKFDEDAETRYTTQAQLIPSEENKKDA